MMRYFGRVRELVNRGAIRGDDKPLGVDPESGHHIVINEARTPQKRSPRTPRTSSLRIKRTRWRPGELVNRCRWQVNLAAKARAAEFVIEKCSTCVLKSSSRKGAAFFNDENRCAFQRLLTPVVPNGLRPEPLRAVDVLGTAQSPHCTRVPRWA